MDRLTILVLAGFGSGLLANVFAELMLVYDLRRPFGSLTARGKWARAGRWAAALAGSALVGLTRPEGANGAAVWGPLAVFALFTVTAATDLETTYIPPDWFVYGATLAGVGVGWWAGGWEGLKDAIVAQAVCYSAMVIAVGLFRSAAGGDIKLAMQYGTVCGSLNAVAVAFIVEWMARVALVACTFVLATRRSMEHDPPAQAMAKAGKAVAEMRVAHGPLAWLGVLAALLTGVAW